ncbi:B-cell receptor-associated protein 29 [Varanus komodoensis]|nr:B-cell receptor-associated protein 29 [Varanus komodoensis]
MVPRLREGGAMLATASLAICCPLRLLPALPPSAVTEAPLLRLRRRRAAAAAAAIGPNRLAGRGSSADEGRAKATSYGASNRMTFQWTAVATFLYAEIAILLLLCLPVISPLRWQKIFMISIWNKIANYWNKAFLAIIILLIVLFLGK